MCVRLKSRKMRYNSTFCSLIFMSNKSKKAVGWIQTFFVVKNGGTDIFRHIRRASLPWISPSSSTPPWRSNSRAHASSSTSSSSCSSFLNLSSTSNAAHHHHHQTDSEFASFHSPTLSFRLKIPVKRLKSVPLSRSLFINDVTHLKYSENAYQ